MNRWAEWAQKWNSADSAQQLPLLRPKYATGPISLQFHFPLAICSMTDDGSFVSFAGRHLCVDLVVVWRPNEDAVDFATATAMVDNINMGSGITWALALALAWPKTIAGIGTGVAKHHRSVFVLVHTCVQHMSPHQQVRMCAHTCFRACTLLRLHACIHALWQAANLRQLPIMSIGCSLTTFTCLLACGRAYRCAHICA